MASNPDPTPEAVTERAPMNDARIAEIRARVMTSEFYNADYLFLDAREAATIVQDAFATITRQRAVIAEREAEIKRLGRWLSLCDSIGAQPSKKVNEYVIRGLSGEAVPE